MPIHDPPQYRYGLFDPWDLEAFEFIKKLAKEKNYPMILGTKQNKNQFLITLIRTQKSTHDWRNLPKDVLSKIKRRGVIDTNEFNKKYTPDKIAKETPLWVTYTEDKIVSDFIDELATKKVNFIGTDQDMAEFILRFILGQLGHDWEQTIMIIWEMLGEKNKIRLKDVNEELKNFDYCKMFE